MVQPANTIVCPNCGTEIDVNEILYQKLDGEIRKQYNHLLSKEQKSIEQIELQLKKDRNEFE